MKIYLKAYLQKNLGDDLFLKIITDRYDEQFESYTSCKYKKNSFANLRLNNNFFLRIINKIIKIISNYKYDIEDFFIKKNDVTVVIGGSMFMESNYKDTYYNLTKNKSLYFILGSNFGPYYNESYYNKFKEIFWKAKDVCFRDSYSYNLFKDNKNVRYTSDIVFSLKVKPNTKAKKNALISVIDCDKKIGSEYTLKYENKIIEFIKFLKSKGYTINLMSFCKREGDEDAINRILSKVDNESINTILYDGNINEALNSINNCDLIIGSRFHANILGLVMNKTVIPVAYSDKTINVLKDIGFKGKYFDIRDMDNFDINSISYFDLTYKCDVTEEKKKAEEHFKVLDTILNRSGK